MVTIFGPVRIQNIYDRLRDEFSFDHDLLALSDRMLYFGHSSMQESVGCLLATPDDLKPHIEKYSALRILSYCQG